MPLLTSAGTKAVAPGRHSTLTPVFTHSLTSKKAGSDIPGVPASVTRAIVFPSSNLAYQVLQYTVFVVLMIG